MAQMGQLPPRSRAEGSVIPYDCPAPQSCRTYYQEYVRRKTQGGVVPSGDWACRMCGRVVCANIPIEVAESGRTFTKQEIRRIQFLRSLSLDKEGSLRQT